MLPLSLRDHLERVLEAPIGRVIGWCKYRARLLQKPGGGWRRLSIPTARGIGVLQHVNAWLFMQPLYIHNAAHGSVKTRSALTAAAQHVDSTTIISFDLHDFFDTIGKRQLATLPLPVGDLRLLLKLTLHEGRLPQGAPTSPLLCNLAAVSLDKKLSAWARAHDATYTRFIDDLTFGFKRQPSTATVERWRLQVERIVRREGFRPNPEKFSVQHDHHRQAVLDLTVNGAGPPRANRRHRRQLRAELHTLSRHVDGVDVERLRGEIAQVQNVDPWHGADLLKRFRHLTEVHNAI